APGRMPLPQPAPRRPLGAGPIVAVVCAIGTLVVAAVVLLRRLRRRVLPAGARPPA
ncbi:MAG: hypothetical protein HOV79_28030, partial [Hamadaea sp.]|nr:hypothetical protein [Hamadaea sp.]